MPFYGNKGIVLGDNISNKKFEIDNTMIEIIEKFHPLVSMKSI